MQRQADSPGPGARFRPRQSSYLRISATTVLQMTLYLEAAHVDWMNHGVLERMLFALKDRIPLKLKQEESRPKSKGRERTQVDVFRGADYQMAFFFRDAKDKHVVLLKDKHIHYTTRSPTSFRAPSRTPSVAPQPQRPAKRPRRGSDSSSVADLDLRNSAAADEPSNAAASRASKRRASAAAVGAPGEDDDELVVVKPEPDDEGGLPPDWASVVSGGGAAAQKGEGAMVEALEDVKPEIDEDVKPTVSVRYSGYKIFGKTLVVIVEPWPPLNPADLARPRLLNTEVRQLSASVAPEAYRRRSTTAHLGSGGGRSSLSVTPAPSRTGGAAGALFRRESTGVESVRGSEAPSEAGGEGGADDDEQMRQLREMSLMLANELDEVDEDDELPSLDALVARSSTKAAQRAAGSPAEDDDEAVGLGATDPALP